MHVGITNLVRDLFNNIKVILYIWDIFAAVEGQEVTYRACGSKLQDKCFSQDFEGGVSAIICNCDTDNCNKDNGCDCSSSPTTQATTTESSSSSIGISALALLVSAFVLF